jgi:hypothetical protein
MLTNVALVMEIIELMGAEIVPFKVFKLARHFETNQLRRIKAALASRKDV